MRQNPAEADIDFRQYQESRVAYWNNIARKSDHWKGWGGYYHKRLAEIYRFLIMPGLRVLELGCAQGDLLASLRPVLGVGVDFSPEMAERAKNKHPEMDFLVRDVHLLDLDETFDVIILSDLVNDLWDLQRAFEQVGRLSNPHTRIIINSYSRLWEIPLAVAQSMNLAKPNLKQNWLTVADLKNLLELTDFDVIRSWSEIISPLPIPLVSRLCNRYLARIWPFRHLALTNFLVARLDPGRTTKPPKSSVSVIIPARNEAGHIRAAFERLPEMGSQTEIIFIEGHSTDNTYETIAAEIAAQSKFDCKLLKQSGVGKGDAVRQGFQEASGDILMILDADLSVPPEDLARFYEALNSGKGDFINGVRLVYPMENRAMRFANQLGNKLFGYLFSWLLGQHIRDTLCGTKALRKADYEHIAANRTYFGDSDPFGDFDLLLGASKLNLKIVELPIRYRERAYGKTNIHRWRHGWMLLKMVIIASRRIKFI